MKSLTQSHLYSALAAAGAFGMSGHRLGELLSKFFGPPASVMPRRHRGTNKFTPHQGERECARRRRQIAAGQLSVSANIWVRA